MTTATTTGDRDATSGAGEAEVLTRERAAALEASRDGDDWGRFIGGTWHEDWPTWDEL